jgi:hypothetical protein
MATATEIATELYAVRSQIAALRLREGDLADRLSAEMESDKLEVEGIGVFERRRKADRKSWNHDELRSELMRAVRDGRAKRVDQETGEILDEDPTEQAFRVIFDCARPEWRVRPLKALQIDPDEYAQVTYGGFSIQIHGELDR